MTESMRHLDLELSSYVDGELDAPAREAVEAHLRDCVSCTALLAELRAVVAGARALEDHAPEVDLWSGIARRIGAVPALALQLPASRRMTPVLAIARRFSFSLPQLAAAALFVALVSGGGVWWTLRGLALARRGVTVPEAPAVSAGGAASAADFDIQRYDQAVAELERALDENHGRLDPETVRTVESNLAVIDAAIAQARRALAADPANPYLTGHLADQMRRKIRVLQRTAEAVTADYSGGAS